MKVPSEIQAKSVGEVVISWHAELQERTDVFAARIDGLALWDRHILDCRLKLLKLQFELGKASSSEDRLERQLDILQAQQLEIMDALTAMEYEVQRLRRNSSADSSATSSQFFNAQESVYCLAEAASARLGRLGDIFSCSIVGSKDHKKVNRKIKSENYSLHVFFPAVSHQEVKEARNNTSQYYSTIEANLEALCSIEGKVQKRAT